MLLPCSGPAPWYPNPECSAQSRGAGTCLHRQAGHCQTAGGLCAAARFDGNPAIVKMRAAARAPVCSGRLGCEARKGADAPWGFCFQGFQGAHRSARAGWAARRGRARSSRRCTCWGTGSAAGARCTPARRRQFRRQGFKGQPLGHAARKMAHPDQNAQMHCEGE